jgi:hypothetical protein
VARARRLSCGRVPAPEPCSELLVPELVAFVHSGLAIHVGSADAALVPAVTRGCAPRVAADRRTIDVFVGRAQSTAVLTNLAPERPMAVTVASPLDYRGIQVKGLSAGSSEARATDHVWVDDYWSRFEINAAVVGFAVEHIRLLRSADLVRVTLVPTAIFRQTPGAGAGGSVEGGARWA